MSDFVLWEQHQIVKVGATVAQVGAALAIIDHFVQVELHMQHPFGLFGQLVAARVAHLRVARHDQLILDAVTVHGRHERSVL